MSSKRVALGFVTAVSVLIAAGFAAAPHAAWGDWGFQDRDRGHGHDDDDAQLANDPRVQKGFEIAPVPLARRNNLIGLGSYIVNGQGGCNDCHTCPPYQPADDPYNHGSGHPNALNYLAGGHNFGPGVTSRNLTPKNGKPAGLTEDQFIHVIRTGEDPEQPGTVLEVMPWPVYRNMTDRDLRAIYAYLSVIPPASPGICTGP